MNTVFILTTLSVISKAVVIDPTTVDDYVTVELRPDPRGINQINAANRWKIYQNAADPLYDWGLAVTLDADEYGFKQGIDGSTITISIDGACSTSQCDAWFAFSFGGDEYFTFVTDLDGTYDINLQDAGVSRNGIFIYPECDGPIVSGDASTLISDISTFTKANFRDAFVEGEDDNAYRLTEDGNGENFPLTFELTNNDNAGTFTFKFTSPTFSGNNALTCTYDKVDTCQDFTLYLSPDPGNEIIKIDDFTITSTSTGCGATDPPTTNPTTAQPTTRLPTPAVGPFIYVSHTNLDCEAARKFCKRNYGTTLATISDALDRQQARDLIGDEQVWFGLYTKDERQWRFLNGDPCPNEDTRFKCIDFWDYRLNSNTDYRPRCIGDDEGGYRCANFDGEENTADNDIDDTSGLTFLCEHPVKSPFPFTSTCPDPAENIYLGGYYGGSGGGENNALNQGRINGISSWGLVSTFSSYTLVIEAFSSDRKTVSDSQEFGVATIDTPCVPFTLDSDEYIIGFTVYWDTTAPLYTQYVYGLDLYTSNGIAYECHYDDRIDDSDIMASTEYYYCDDDTFYYLSGWSMRTGAIIDGFQAQFTRITFPFTPTCPDPAQDTYLGGYYGGSGGGPIAALNQGRINGISSWGLVSGFSSYTLVIEAFSSDSKTISDSQEFGSATIDTPCTPFTLDSDEYIIGFTVYWDTTVPLVTQYVYGLDLYTSNGITYECHYDDRVDDSDIMASTEYYQCDDDTFYYLSGWNMRIGSIIDGFQAQFTKATNDS